MVEHFNAFSVAGIGYNPRKIRSPQQAGSPKSGQQVAVPSGQVEIGIGRLAHGVLTRQVDADVGRIGRGAEEASRRRHLHIDLRPAFGIPSKPIRTWADHEVIDHDAHLGKSREELGQPPGSRRTQVEPEHVVFAGGVFPDRTRKVVERAEPEADDRAVFSEAIHLVGGRGRVGRYQADAQEAVGIGA